MVNGVAVIFPSSVSVILREKTNKSPLINMSIYTTFPLPHLRKYLWIYSYDVTNAKISLALQELCFENQDRWCLCHKEQRRRIHFHSDIQKSYPEGVRCFLELLVMPRVMWGFQARHLAVEWYLQENHKPRLSYGIKSSYWISLQI